MQTANFQTPTSKFGDFFRYADTLKAKLLFQQAWNAIVKYYGIENIKLPREIFFLMGAPG
jgi:hypothetical protein